MFQTHNIALTNLIADFVVSLGSDGRVISQGSLDKAVIHNQALLGDTTEEVRPSEIASHQVDRSAPEVKKKGDGKLVMKEEISEGHVGWRARKFGMSMLNILFANLTTSENVFREFGRRT